MKNRRYEFLDFAKGLAVIFMVVQHIGIWMWKMPWSKVVANFKGNSIYIILNTLSGLSAPLFIFSAGAGAYLLMEKYKSSSKIIKRGIFIITLGYVHNLTIIYWFNYGSWYVLHLIGFGFILVPLIKKMQKKSVIILIILLIVLTYLAQTGLDTSIKLTNKNMRDMSLSFAMLRLAFVEGHFPILPWITFFLLGYISISAFMEKEKAVAMVLIGLSLLIFSTILLGVGIVLPELKESDIFIRLFYIEPRFYPLILPMLLFLLGLVLIVMQLIKFLCNKFSVGEYNPVVVLGRFSLTVFFMHVYLKLFLYHYKLNQTFEKPVTMIAIIAAIFIFTALGYLSKYTKYKFSLEGLLRKLS